MRSCGNSLFFQLFALFVLLLLAPVALLAPAPAQAASILVTPPASVISCGSPACGSIDVQVSLDLGEIDADSFAFDIMVTNPSDVGLAPGALAGNPIAGINGSVTLLPDGVTIRGLLDSLPTSFDGPIVFNVARIPLSAAGPIGSLVEFRFASAEIACSTCLAGNGVIYANSNLSNQLLAAVTIVPEPGPALLMGIGLLGLGVAGSRVGEGL